MCRLHPTQCCRYSGSEKGLRCKIISLPADSGLPASQLEFHSYTYPDALACRLQLWVPYSVLVIDIASCAAGSGVLAIAALKLGAAQAYGTDTDALAVRAAAQNAALNTMEGRFQAVQCEASAEGPEPLAAAKCGPASVSGAFDVVMANILQVTTAPSRVRVIIDSHPHVRAVGLHKGTRDYSRVSRESHSVSEHVIRLMNPVMWS